MLRHAVHHDVTIYERMLKKYPKVVRIDQGGNGLPAVSVNSPYVTPVL